MIKIILDGSKMKNEKVTHKMLKEIFEFPDYYGKNLDALWDCLTDWYLDEKAEIIWINFAKSKILLGDYAEKILQTFYEASEEYGQFTMEVIE